MPEALDFLTALFQDTEIPHLIWTLPDKLSYWFTDPAQSASTVETLKASKDVYVGVGLAPRDMGPRARCKANEIAGMVGLWADLDTADPVHSKTNLPPDEESAVGLLDSMGLQPTVVVRSGHGLHAWWLFTEPWIFDSPEERKKASQLAVSWIYTLKARATEKGWGGVDSVIDISRVLRVPGTLNHKDASDVKPVTCLRFRPDVRYSPDDFKDYILESVAHQVEQGRYALKDASRIGSLTLNPAAQPPLDKFMLLMENDDRFKRTWEHKRSTNQNDMPDQSMSSYDMSLCNLAYMSGWTDQEIVNLLIFHRAQYHADLKLREDYYKRTLERAHSDIERNVEALEVMETIKAETKSIKDAPPEEKDSKRTGLLQMLSERLGVPIRRFVKYRCDPPKYDLITDLGTVRFEGAKAWMVQANFRESVVQGIDFLCPWFKKDWETIQQGLLGCIEHEDLGEEATTDGETLDWLNSYLEEKRFAETIEESNPFRDERGTVFLHVNDVWAWLKRRGEKNLLKSDLSMRLKRVGAERCRKGNERVWSLAGVKLHTIKE